VKKRALVKLLELNRQFYQTFAVQFSDTRMHLQPGVKAILEQIPLDANVLDLGCGNGELALELVRSGHRGQYIGLDFSKTVLDLAKNRLVELDRRFAESSEFLQIDLAIENWSNLLPKTHFDYVLAFSVLHHIPGEKLRSGLLKQVKSCFQLQNKGNDTGIFIHSQWQFLNSPRLRERIVPWETIGLTQTELDPGDYLLDWRSGGYGLRYVHHFDDIELAHLADNNHFSIIDTFYSDGEGGILGLYHIWRIRNNTRPVKS
jgi:tRNA (uracil-5-)-methyltransferase TRM9